MADDGHSEEFSFPWFSPGDDYGDNSVDLSNPIWHPSSNAGEFSSYCCSFPTCSRNNSTRKDQLQQNQNDEEEEFATPRSSATPKGSVFMNKLYNHRHDQRQEDEEFITSRSTPTTPKRAYFRNYLHHKEEEFTTPKSISTSPNKVYLNPIGKFCQKVEEFSTPRSQMFTPNRDFMNSIQELWDFHDNGCTPRRSFSGDDEEEKMDMLWEEYNYEELVAMAMNHQQLSCGEKSSTGDSSSSSSAASTPGLDGLCCVHVIHMNKGAAVVPVRRTAGLHVIFKVFKKLFLLHSAHRRH